MTRQIVIDTETTGLEPEHGHRIIEIGCIELVDGEPTGNSIQAYLDPERDIDPAATDKHGFTRADVERLSGGQSFSDIAEELLQWLHGAELIIHNAPFDVGFLDAELSRLGLRWGTIADYCPSVVCTVALSRRLVPDIRHDLDSVCDYYGIDRSHRTRHGALVDAELTALVYMALQTQAAVSTVVVG